MINYVEDLLAIGMIAFVLVIASCGTGVPSNADTEQCVLDGSDSTLTCGENRFIVY